MNSSSERGSAIIMLFIALALFAALGFAFMQGSRTSTTMITDQQAKVNAQQLVAYANDVKMAVKRLQLKGCTETQISFQSASAPDPTWYENPNSPADKSCHIFEANGGGLAWQNPPAPHYEPSVDPALFATRKYGYVTGYQLIGIGTSCASAACTDLILLMASNKMDLNTCNKINELVGAPLNVEDSGISGIPFKGTYDYSGFVFGDEPTSAAAAGKSTVCWKAPSGTFMFHSVLIAR